MQPIIPADSIDDWGVIPTSTGDPLEPAATTQAVQAANAATQSTIQAVFLPPAPTWSPLLDPNGNMTAPWITWFQTLNRKLGGYASTPADDALILSDDAGASTAAAVSIVQADLDPWAAV